MKTNSKFRVFIANLLRKLARKCDPVKKPPVSRSTVSVTRSNGAMLAMSQWVVQVLITGKRPVPDMENNVTVFFPQFDLNSESVDGQKKFTLNAQVTTMQTSSFSGLTAELVIRPTTPEEKRHTISEWVIVKADFQLKLSGSTRTRDFYLTEDTTRVRELNPTEIHFRHYLERLLSSDNRKAQAA
jgi:hypothetical protein